MQIIFSTKKNNDWAFEITQGKPSIKLSGMPKLNSGRVYYFGD